MPRVIVLSSILIMGTARRLRIISIVQLIGANFHYSSHPKAILPYNLNINLTKTVSLLYLTLRRIVIPVI